MWTGIETVDACGRCKRENTIISLTPEFVGKCRGFVEEYKDLEWAGVIRGQLPAPKNPVFVCENFIVPEQEVGEASADPTENLQGIGIIHSHNRMNAFFSPDDLKSASNYPLSLVVNNDLEFKAKVRRQLACGAYYVGDAKIQYYVPTILPSNEEKAKIKEKKHLSTQKSLFEPSGFFPHQVETGFDEFKMLMQLKPEEAVVRFTSDDTFGELHSRDILWEKCKKSCGKRNRKVCWKENVFWVEDDFVLICPKAYNKVTQLNRLNSLSLTEKR